MIFFSFLNGLNENLENGSSLYLFFSNITLQGRSQEGALGNPPLAFFFFVGGGEKMRMKTVETRLDLAPKERKKNLDFAPPSAILATPLPLSLSLSLSRME